MTWGLATRWTAETDTVVDAWWLCCAVLRCTAARGDEALADALREGRAITAVLGMAETPLGLGLRREGVTAEELELIAQQRGPNGAGTPATVLWPSVRPLLALSLAWGGVIEGHPVVRGFRGRLSAGHEEVILGFAARVVAQADQSAAVAREMAPVLMAAWGGDPGRTACFGDMLALDPGLAVGCWFV